MVEKLKIIPLVLDSTDIVRLGGRWCIYKKSQQKKAVGNKKKQTEDGLNDF